MRKNRIINSMAMVIMTIAIFLNLEAPVLAVQGAADASQAIQESTEKQNQLKEEIKQKEGKVSSLTQSKSGIEGKIKDLDSKLTELSEEMENLKKQIEEKNIEIETAKKDLDEAKKREKSQYKDMKARIRFMYENNDNYSYVAALLSSRSISDFINRAEYIKQMVQYDRDKLKEYEKAREDVVTAKERLESENQEYLKIQEQAKEEEVSVNETLEAKEAELAKVIGEIDATNQAIADAKAEIEAEEELIQQIRKAEEARKKREEEERKRREEEEKRKEEENSKEEEKVSSFIWPCPISRRVTSDYGTRVSPTEGASTNHKGIDIGAPIGADIVAAADGVVIAASYSNAGGNYVMIDHGDGLYTIYMHASILCVNEGDVVNGGSIIAKVGSTGISTGPHLHFGVSLNGEYVSPWNYVSG